MQQTAHKNSRKHEWPTIKQKHDIKKTGHGGPCSLGARMLPLVLWWCSTLMQAERNAKQMVQSVYLFLAENREWIAFT